jgi:hypothetical protein
MKVFKVLLVKNRGLHSISSFGKRIRYSTKRVNTYPKGSKPYLYSCDTLEVAKRWQNAFAVNGKKYVIYEAISINRVNRGSTTVLSRKLKLVKRVK